MFCCLLANSPKQLIFLTIFSLITSAKMKVRSSAFASIILIFEVLAVALFLRGFFPVPVKSSLSKIRQELPMEPLSGKFSRMVLTHHRKPDAPHEVCLLNYRRLAQFVSRPAAVVQKGSNHVSRCTAGGLCVWSQWSHIHALHKTPGGERLNTQLCFQSSNSNCHHAQDQSK